MQTKYDLTKTLTHWRKRKNRYLMKCNYSGALNICSREFGMRRALPSLCRCRWRCWRIVMSQNVTPLSCVCVASRANHRQNHAIFISWLRCIQRAHTHAHSHTKKTVRDECTSSPPSKKKRARMRCEIYGHASDLYVS